MEYYQAVVLGLIQGLTEFLPVSSSGHLVVIPHMLGISLPSPTVDIFLHFGTLLSLCYYFRRDISKLMSTFFFCF